MVFFSFVWTDQIDQIKILVGFLILKKLSFAGTSRGASEKPKILILLCKAFS
jgi:hypothetical protein